MILYFTYFFLSAMFVLSTSSYFLFLFNLLHVPSGGRTVVIQVASLTVTALIVMLNRSSRFIVKELGSLLVIWVPFLLYLVSRTDFADAYAVIKFGKILTIHFLCAITITTVYLANTTAFNKYFYPSMIILSALLGIEAVVNPQVFHYRSVVERLTIEDVNPIWLARTFAIAALCLAMLPSKRRIFKAAGIVLCIVGILATGSRGPLISLGLVLVAYFLVGRRGANIRRSVKVGVAIAVVTAMIAAAGVGLTNFATRYFERGQRIDMVDESGRPMLFAKAISEFAGAPLLGVGLGKYGEGSIPIRGNRTNQGIYPHNILLEMLAETGLIGLSLYVWGLRPGRWLAARRNPYNYLFYLCLLFSMTSGDMSSNVGVTLFAVLARISHRYPQETEDRR